MAINYQTGILSIASHEYYEETSKKKQRRYVAALQASVNTKTMKRKFESLLTRELRLLLGTTPVTLISLETRSALNKLAGYTDPHDNGEYAISGFVSLPCSPADDIEYFNEDIGITIPVESLITTSDLKETLCHELVHYRQYLDGHLRSYLNEEKEVVTWWKGTTYPFPDHAKEGRRTAKEIILWEVENLPWETEAYRENGAVHASCGDYGLYLKLCEVFGEKPLKRRGFITSNDDNFDTSMFAPASDETLGARYRNGIFEADFKQSDFEMGSCDHVFDTFGAYPHPTQPVRENNEGKLVFRQNKIVKDLFSGRGKKLNLDKYSRDDLDQVRQLLGAEVDQFLDGQTLSSFQRAAVESEAKFYENAVSGRHGLDNQSHRYNHTGVDGFNAPEVGSDYSVHLPIDLPFIIKRLALVDAHYRLTLTDEKMEVSWVSTELMGRSERKLLPEGDTTYSYPYYFGDCQVVIDHKGLHYGDVNTKQEELETLYYTDWETIERSFKGKGTKEGRIIRPTPAVVLSRLVNQSETVLKGGTIHHVCNLLFRAQARYNLLKQRLLANANVPEESKQALKKDKFDITDDTCKQLLKKKEEYQLTKDTLFCLRWFIDVAMTITNGEYIFNDNGVMLTAGIKAVEERCKQLESIS